jgi:hypothetical protein
MAKKMKMAHGAKTAEVVRLAKRINGVSSQEIMAATGWPGGSAQWRVTRLAEQLGLHVSKPITRRNGSIGFRLMKAA